MASIAFRLELQTAAFRNRKCDGLVQTDQRMVIQCTASAGVSNKIFAYLRKSRINGNGDYEEYDEFDHVCSPTDMEDYPEDLPKESENPRWFRRSDVDLLVRHVDIVEEVWSNIQRDVRTLRELMEDHNDIAPTDIYTTGNPELLPEIP